ncbi:MAG TPA: lysophospholipid acyltransferase family protein, partial [Flavobacterium sp.]|nr:lysophospholipid acyltransferase family protein [Flavobacterium sp.]
VLFKIFIENRPKKGLSPVSLRIALESLISFALFGVVGILVSVSMRIFYVLAPVSKTRKYKVMGKMMSFFQGFILGLKPTVKRKMLGKQYFDKSKQTVIISNHTSFLDSLAQGMYHSNIVYLVNDWVIKSSIFGRFAKAAGFYPVTEGAEDSIQHLKDRIGTDFSIMVFPEGTRSYSHEIKRFHKGAFYVAQQLQLPIQPILLHGVGEMIPKGDYMIYDGHIINKVLPAIEPNDARFGVDYAERTKKVSRYYKEQFEELRKELETPDYYRQKLFLNYLYKEHHIVKTVKSDFKEYKKAYWELNHLIDAKQALVHFTNDYGQTDFLLLKHAPSRKIQTVNTNDEAREVSQTSYLAQIRDLRYVPSFSEVEQSKSFNVLLCSHGAEVPDEVLNKFSKVFCFLSPNVVPKTMHCVLQTNEIQVYEQR